MTRALFFRVALGAMSVLVFGILPGCSSGEAEPTEAGVQSDMQYMEESAAANDAAGGMGAKSKR